MSIQTDLTRIKNAKAAIKAAIEGKGVTVPDGTLLDGMAALIEAIEAGGGGDQTLLGGKFTAGEFVLAEETTSKYVIATSNDDGILNLLNEGEELSNANVYNSIGLLIYKKATDKFSGSSYPKCVVLSIHVPTYYGNGSGFSQVSLYTDAYGSIRASTLYSVGANVSYNGLSMQFESSYKGTPDFTYCWIAWRLLK